MTCRICLEPDNLISICGCKGTSEFVHRECILHWIKIKKNKTCELCQQYLQIEEPKPALKIEPYIINTISTHIYIYICNKNYMKNSVKFTDNF